MEAEKNNGIVIDELISYGRESPMGYFHLPSSKWIESRDVHFYESVYGPDASSPNIRALAGTNFGYCVWEIDRTGVQKQIQKLGNEVEAERDFKSVPQLIPRSNQCLFVRGANWPQWLREQGMKIGFLKQIFEPERHELVFLDYCKQRELATIRVGAREVSRARISPKGNYLIVEHHNDQDHEVMVFSIPLADWSPWWARCAGLITSLLVWLILCKAFSKQNLPSRPQGTHMR